jgi:hypothetical protein
MLKNVVFLTDTESVIRVYNELKKDSSLVGSIRDNREKVDIERKELMGAVLVWEDDQNIGRYRIHFYGQHEVKPTIWLHYWDTSERPAKLFEKSDPMKGMVKKVRDLLNYGNMATDDWDRPINLDDL